MVSLIWANDDGEIAACSPGAYPLRNNQNVDGRYVKNGWIKENDWKGLLPGDQIPHVLNPSRGYMVNANN